MFYVQSFVQHEWSSDVINTRGPQGEIDIKVEEHSEQLHVYLHGDSQKKLVQQFSEQGIN